MEALVTRISGVRNDWFPTPERPSPPHMLPLSHVSPGGRRFGRPSYRDRRSAAARPCSRHKHQFREMKAIPIGFEGLRRSSHREVLLVPLSQSRCGCRYLVGSTKSPSSKYPPLMTLSALILLGYKKTCKTSLLRSEIIFKHNLAEGRHRNASLARLKRSLLPINFTHKIRTERVRRDGK